MANDLVLLQQQMAPLVPRFAAVLGSVMPPQRLVQTLMISCERTPKLLLCDRQSLFNGAMTFAVLGLEVDGATGQAFLVPFNDRKANKLIAQPIIGYKGYNTIGARSGLTIMGGVVREGDEFDWDEGTKPFVHHKKKLGEPDRRIIAAWATAASNTRPPTIKVLSIDDILAIKAKSPRGNEPPWADRNGVGFAAMAEKTAKRRLARDMPLNVFQRAAVMEEAFEERGLPSFLRDDGAVMIDGQIEAQVLPPSRHDVPTPTMEELIGPDTAHTPASSAGHGGRGHGEEEAPRSPPSVEAASSPVAPEPADDSEIIAGHDKDLGTAAAIGSAALKAAWEKVPAKYQHVLTAAKDKRHKPAAAAADAARAKEGTLL